MRVKTAELNGSALNWAAAVAVGFRPEDLRRSFGDSLNLVLRDGDKELTGTVQTGLSYLSWASPLGGQIIEREGISVIPFDDRWEARCACSPLRSVARFVERRGPTPLIAAMRCFVASKLGDEIDLPKELT